jgi:hypothetical protein
MDLARILELGTTRVRRDTPREISQLIPSAEKQS